MPIDACVYMIAFSSLAGIVAGMFLGLAIHRSAK